MRVAFVVIRFLLAAAVVAAIVVQLNASIDAANQQVPGQVPAVLTNFFSYFTIDANLLTVVSMVLGGLFLLRGTPLEPGWFTTFRAAVTTYMVITGIVYNLLLRGLLVQGNTIPWSNEVLHVIAPIVVLIDWLFAPGRNAMRQRSVLYVAAFPLLWCVYTLIRGPFGSDPYTGKTYWYPYPFINPETSSYGSVVLYIIGIAIVIIAVASGAAWLSRRSSPAVAARR